MSRIFITVKSYDVDGNENGNNGIESVCLDGREVRFGVGYLPGLDEIDPSKITMTWRGQTFSPKSFTVETDWDAEQQILTFER